jgi:hypothetical protein
MTNKERYQTVQKHSFDFEQNISCTERMLRLDSDSGRELGFLSIIMKPKSPKKLAAIYLEQGNEAKIGA